MNQCESCEVCNGDGSFAHDGTPSFTWLARRHAYILRLVEAALQARQLLRVYRVEQAYGRRAHDRRVDDCRAAIAEYRDAIRVVRAELKAYRVDNDAWCAACRGTAVESPACGHCHELVDRSSLDEDVWDRTGSLVHRACPVSVGRAA